MNKQKETLKYFKTRVKKLPYHECFLNEQGLDRGLVNVFISKKQASGNYVFTLFLVDIYCLGVKNVLLNFNLSDIDYDDFLGKLFQSDEYISCDLADAHNIIYGAIDYAEELGFKPHKDFAIAEHILDADLIDDGIDEIEFGNNGKPLFVAGPYDNVNRIIAVLERNVGEGNYDYVIEAGALDYESR